MRPRGVAVCLTAASATVLLSVLTPAAASAGSDRMQLHCQDGRTIERSNGSSWWGAGDDSGYVTEHLLITSGGEVLFEKYYGEKGTGDRSTCTADHVGVTWTVDLVRTR